MPPLITRKASGRIWPKNDPRRAIAVVKEIDHTQGHGVIRANDEDVLFFREDVLGSFDNVRPGQTVTFLPVIDHLGMLPTLICNIHDPESERALIAHQTAPALVLA